MNHDQLYRHYQDYQSYVGWVAADEDHVRAAASVLQPHLAPLIDDFYAEIARHAETRKVIEGGQTTLERLKATLLQWLQELLAGPYDREYVARRWQVGKRHIEVGLAQVSVSTAVARLRAGLVETLSRYWPGEREGLVPAILSLNKLLDLDLTIIENAYQTEYLAQVRQNEQLARVGQVAASVGHELREPLNVLKTSAYYLRHASNPAPAKRTEHFQRIASSMAVAEQILMELSDFARTPVPQVGPFPVVACVDEALEQARLRDNILLSRYFPHSLPLALGDRTQIRNAFVRLIRRARDGMRDGGQLSIRGQDAVGGVEVVFEDTGLGMSRETLAALVAPLSWDSVRVLGMNLAMARAMLDVNAAGLRGDCISGKGCQMTVTLAAALPAALERLSQLPH
jgi:signal transduction histidine kinase